LVAMVSMIGSSPSAPSGSVCPSVPMQASVSRSFGCLPLMSVEVQVN
jgi:hypothetical protein